MIDCIPSRPKKKYPSTTVRYANRSQRYHLGDDEVLRDGAGGGEVKRLRDGGRGGGTGTTGGKGTGTLSFPSIDGAHTEMLYSIACGTDNKALGTFLLS